MVKKYSEQGEPSLILFDCDGTLVNSHGAIVDAMQKAFMASGLLPPPSENVHAVIGLSLSEAVRKLHGMDNPSIMQAYRDYYVASEAGLALFPGVRETISTLRERGYWLGIVTGKSRPGLLRVMDQFSLTEHFLVWRTADCCPSKPHPGMVLESMHELGVGGGNTTVVGDACFDMEMAKAAGVAAIGVSFGVATADQLEKAGAGAIAHDFSDLLEYFPHLQDDMASATIAS